MNRVNFFGSFFTILLLILPASASADDNIDVFAQDYHPSHLIVGMKNGKTLDSNDPALGAAGVYHKAQLAQVRQPGSDTPQYTGNAIHLVETDGTFDIQTSRSALLQHPDVAYVEPDYVVTTTLTPNDPMFSSLYGMTRISAENAWNITTGSSGVVVGVIDTGIDNTHPDLAGNIWSNPGEIAGNGIDDDGNGYVDDTWGWDFINNDNDPFDDVYHGTHVSGTIGAIGNNGVGVVGVNWNVQLASLKFLGQFGGFTSDAIEAVAYANAMGIKITNNSWGGGGYSQALKDVIDAAGALGYLFVAAAGNNGRNTDITPAYPASYDSSNIISVAASDSSDNIASFSNYGSTTVDLGAPGVSILSTYPANSYNSISGTSMASPHVAGTAALLLDILDGTIPDTSLAGSIKASILNTVDPVAAFSNTVTGGRLNAYQAVVDATGQPPELLTADKSSMTFNIPAGGTDSDTVTVTNLTNRTQVVNLSGYQEWVALGVLTLSDTVLTIPPNGSTPLTVTIITQSYTGVFTLNLGWQIVENGTSGIFPINITIP